MDRNRALVPVLAALGLIALLVFTGDRTGDQSAADTTIDLPPIPSPTTSTTATTTTTTTTTITPAPRPISEAVPGPLVADIPAVRGHLWVVTGQGGRGFQLRVRDVVNAGDNWLTTLPHLDAFGFSVDAGGGHLAYLRPVTDLANALWLVSPRTEASEVIPLGVADFELSGDRPGELAWLQEDAAFPGQLALNRARIEDGALVDTQLLGFVASNADLAGFNSRGYWIIEPGTPSSFVIHQPPDASGFRLAADIAAVSPDGNHTLLGDLNLVDWNWQWVRVTAAPLPIPWAPAGAGGEYGFVALSRNEHFAFIGPAPQASAESWLEVWDLDGEVLQRNEVPFRVWDVRWSHDDRFVLMPGFDNAGEHVLLIHDVTINQTHFVYHDDWIQYAALTR